MQLSFEILTPLNFVVQFFNQTVLTKMLILGGRVHKNGCIHECTLLGKFACMKSVPESKQHAKMCLIRRNSCEKGCRNFRKAWQISAELN